MNVTFVHATVNLLDGEYEEDVHVVLGETIDAVADRLAAASPDWTSMMLVFVNPTLSSRRRSVAT